MRWWDGQSWTQEVRPGGVGPGGGGPGGFGPGGGGPGGFGPDPGADRAREAKTGRTASLAVLAGAALYSAQFLVGSVYLNRFWHAFRVWLDAPVNADGTRVHFFLPSGVGAYQLASNLVGIGVLVVEVLFVVWFYQAATVAQRAGIPARRSPTWAVVGWIIPIVNLWFPYESAVDLFPPGHPGRHKVARWWALWLATSFSGLAVTISSIVSVGLGVAVGLVATVVAFVAAFAARDLIAEVDRAHADLVGR